MAKIMLVEDDTSLLEIYQARLEAEGFNVVVAHDGEEALTVALKEHPDLIIADVMMPKVSGFDMVDILRSTPETKGTKIIMMTALNQAEDKARAEKLGADRYLVKSQVTLEDVTKVVNEILAQQEAAVSETVQTTTGQAPEVNSPEPTSPAAKPMPKIEQVPVAMAPSPDVNTQTSEIEAPLPVAPSSSANQNQATKIDVVENPTQDQGEQKTPDTTSEAEQKTGPSPQPTKIEPLEVVDQPPEQTQAPEPKISMPKTSEGLPQATTIQVTDDNDDQTQSSKETDKDDFLATNPTLTDKADDDAASSSSSTEPTKDPVDNSKAEAAVESLLQKSPEKNTNEKVSAEETSDSPDSAAKIEDKSKSSTYVASEEDSSNTSLEHTKKIEPTPGITIDQPATLPSLDEMNNEAPVGPPAVNSVIAPDAQSGPASSSVQAQ